MCFGGSYPLSRRVPLGENCPVVGRASPFALDTARALMRQPDYPAPSSKRPMKADGGAVDDWIAPPVLMTGFAWNDLVDGAS